MCTCTDTRAHTHTCTYVLVITPAVTSAKGRVPRLCLNRHVQSMLTPRKKAEQAAGCRGCCDEVHFLDGRALHRTAMNAKQQSHSRCPELQILKRNRASVCDTHTHRSTRGLARGSCARGRSRVTADVKQTHFRHSHPRKSTKRTVTKEQLQRSPCQSGTMALSAT